MCLEVRGQPRGSWECTHTCRQDLWVVWSEHWKSLGVVQPTQGTREESQEGP